MKPVTWLTIILGTLLIALFLFITSFETEIASSYIKLFPTQRDKSMVYWIDLTYMLYNELVRICIFIIATVYLAQNVNTQSLFNKIEGRLLKNTTATIGATVLLFTVLSTFVAAYILDAFPNSADEYAYLFQAEAISRGKLWDTPHQLKDFFEFHHIAQVNDVWVGRFPPGWPLVLAIGYLASIPTYLVNVVLGAVSLIVLFIFCKRFYNERVAVWATVCTAFTACVIFNAASFFSHTASFLELLLFVYFLYLYMDERKAHQALLAGFFLALLTITRYFTAFLIFIPFIVYLIYNLRLKSINAFILIGLGSIPPMAFFFWYNYTITGDPLLPVTMWAYNDEALGFVNGHTPAKGVEYVMRRILMFVAWVSPAFLILYAVLLWNKMKHKSKWLMHPEDYGFVLLMIGYFFYYHNGGNQYGPRFYFEAIPFVIVFAIVKVLQSRNRWGYALIITGTVYALVKIPIIASHEHAIIEEREHVYQLVEEKGVRNAVIFLSSGAGLLRPMPNKDLTRNDKSYKNDVIYALDLKEKNKELMDYYKGRNFYIYKRASRETMGELMVLKPQENLTLQTAGDN
ncbi:glycosyltransferase family 39 protein [Chryseosolibacter indicus]|uniref:Glycosyltransferase family 39 protein n=1 Tax=Chryseosolibacter indicus TaxID=2782351 RepID=A0ABS5VP86_9BACT|nr:glycosyltransferase family 39 protein [Chryseosolibacter indicus]MBT1702833.1 glycosyltransferase family 39 protein [Chryseosolibacter indicus]